MDLARSSLIKPPCFKPEYPASYPQNDGTSARAHINSRPRIVPWSPVLCKMYRFCLCALASCILVASATVLPSRAAAVHLAVSPTCGTLSGAPADVNAGLGALSSFRTIVAFGGIFRNSRDPRLSSYSPWRFLYRWRYGKWWVTEAGGCFATGSTGGRSSE